MGVEARGVYRQDVFNGLTDYRVYDSDGQLILKAEVLNGYASSMLEDRISTWLDLVDPIIEPSSAAA